MRQEKIEIIYRDISEIIPDESNPRRNDMAIDVIVNSIRQFGMRNPIIIDDTNMIVAGHTRFKACERLGITSVPCVMADKLTPKQLKAFQLADNKTAELATWDNKLLAMQLDDLNGLFDMTDFGFEPPRQKETSSQKTNRIDNGMVKCPRCGCEFPENDNNDQEMLF